MKNVFRKKLRKRYWIISYKTGQDPAGSFSEGCISVSAYTFPSVSWLNERVIRDIKEPIIITSAIEVTRADHYKLFR